MNLPADEPKGTGSVATTLELVQAFNWYNLNATANDAAEILHTKTGIAERFTTLAWVERMKERGFYFAPATTKSIEQMRADLKMATVTKEDVVVKVNPVDAMRAKAHKMLGEIESQIDRLRTDASKSFNWYEYITGLGVKSAHVPAILAEINVAKQYLDQPEVFDPIVADLNRLAQNKSMARRAPKAKIIKAADKVARLQYCRRSDEFKIESINPESILGASGLWALNVKYRQLVYFVGSGGLSVSGTTLKNIDLDKSVRKTLRKPLDVLPELLKSTPRQAAKLFAGLKTKASKTTARITKDVVLLKVER